VKVALIGAGGTRMPLLVHGLLVRQAAIGLDEIALVDTDAKRLDVMTALLGHLRAQASPGADVRIAPATLDEALQGASFVFSAMRVGGALGRVKDERIPLGLGVLGQETTGPGGMAMALRTIPVAVDIARRLKRRSPGAWLINFTNPSGLVTEAVSDAGFSRVVGLCDAPSSLAHGIARFRGVDDGAISLSYAGLNHLGWAVDVKERGRSILTELIALGESLVASVRPLNPFSAGLIRTIGCLPNEYLAYYYLRQATLAGILAAKETRGEELLRRESALYPALAERLGAGDGVGALEVYGRFVSERRSGYMEREIGKRRPVGPESVFTEEGYEGLALRVMTGLAGAGAEELVLNVRSPSPLGDGVIETTCTVDRGVTAHPWPGLPPHAMALVQAVKTYERLTVKAVREGERKAAVEALLAHPLVGDHGVATALVDAFLVAHSSYLPAFH